MHEIKNKKAQQLKQVLKAGLPWSFSTTRMGSNVFQNSSMISIHKNESCYTFKSITKTSKILGTKIDKSLKEIKELEHIPISKLFEILDIIH